jgi:FkbM family methyltransferase
MNPIDAFKSIARVALNAVGVDLRLTSQLRYAAQHKWELEQDAKWRSFLSHRDIKTVIDVGANTGQFATLIHRQCPKAKIISFEPLDSCHADLQAVLIKIPGSRIIKAAVGDIPGTAKMNSSEFSPCSSLLSGSELLGEDYTEAAHTKTIDVNIVRIDDALKDDTLVGDILVKFDVQGFEIPAMRGAQDLLQKATIVVCEVCFFRKLYDGQPLFDDIYRELSQRGFRFMGNAEQSLRKADGRVVEADAIFERID